MLNAVGPVLTVTTMDALHPPVVVYVIVVGPGETPVTNPPPPGPGVTVATPVFELVHVPPANASLNCVVRPGQMVVVPLMVPGSAFTVTVFVAVPQALAYVITAVPAVPPVTTPVAVITDAMDELLLLHVPTGELLLNVTEEPEHMDTLPGIVAGGNVMETLVVADTEHVPSVAVNV